MARRPLEGRVVALTGASQGIGTGLAAAMHDAGALLVLAARNVACDVTQVGDRARLVEETVAAHGRIDVLVNNAGAARSAPVEEELPEDVDRVVATNLMGPLHLCTAAAPYLGSGSSIVNVASISGLRVLDRFGLASYGASKAGLIALTRELAHQWGPRGIRVNAVAPGWFPTPMTGFLEDEGQRRWIEERTSLGRPGEVAELAGPVVFLASDASSYVTGQVLAVDGGWV